MSADRTRAAWQIPRMEIYQPTVVSADDWKAQPFPAVPCVFLQLRQVYRSFCLQTNIYWAEFQIKALPVRVRHREEICQECEVAAGPGETVGTGGWREKQRSQLLREVCVFSCPLPAWEWTGLWLRYERQRNSLPGTRLAFLKWSRWQRCPEPLPVWTSGSRPSSRHNQKPISFPRHHAHVRLRRGSASFSFKSSWVTKLFCWLVLKSLICNLRLVSASILALR